MRFITCVSFVTALGCLGLVACSNGTDKSTESAAPTEASELAEISSFFQHANVVSAPSIVDCTLSGGTRTRCFSITVKSEPSSYTPGPWCPNNVGDGPDAGGIWMSGGTVHDVDGEFVKNLATFYKDDSWQLFDPETGKVKVTDSLEACQAAARPDVDPAYNNYCVQCLPEYLGADATMTYVIPLHPQPSDHASPTARSHSGIASNGVLLDGPAPLDAILDAHTIAPFDDCGGHVNPHAGYHYHAVTDCLDAISPASAHGAQIGIAMDGYRILSHHLGDGSDAIGLDRCNGHSAEGMGYHYHAGEPGSNAILGCMTAEFGCASENASQTCDASARRPPPPGQGPPPEAAIPASDGGKRGGLSRPG